MRGEKKKMYIFRREYRLLHSRKKQAKKQRLANKICIQGRTQAQRASLIVHFFYLYFVKDK